MLNISIVLYHPRWEQEVIPLVQELLRVRCLRKIYLLDNTAPEYRKAEIAQQKETLAAQFGTDKMRYMAMSENLGYGRAHNIALRESAYYRTDGSQQYLAKRLPSPLDVFGRRFLPALMMTRRNKRYELRDMDLSHPINAPYLSGCFMLLRTKAAVEAGLFDERYFMYPEDIDLTRTIHRNYLTLYYPEWTIVHNHARGSYKDKHLLWIHIQNMCRYFNKWGWIWDRERRMFNRQLQ